MAIDHQDHLANTELLKYAWDAFRALEKRSFIPASDPSMGAGGGDPSGGAGGGDPSMAAAGGDPSGGAGGGAAGGGAAGDPRIDMLMQQMQQMQQMMQGGGMGGGGMGGGMGGAGKNALTPKIDEKAVMLQILKIQARIADQLGVQIPASEMVVNQTDMMGLAQSSQAGAPLPGMDPSAAGGAGGGAGGAGAVPPVQGMEGLAPAGTPGGAQKAGSWRGDGSAYDATGHTRLGLGGVAYDSNGLMESRDRASAVARILKQARSNSA